MWLLEKGSCPQVTSEDSTWLWPRVGWRMAFVMASASTFGGLGASMDVKSS